MRGQRRFPNEGIGPLERWQRWQTALPHLCASPEAPRAARPSPRAPGAWQRARQRTSVTAHTIRAQQSAQAISTALQGQALQQPTSTDASSNSAWSSGISSSIQLSASSAMMPPATPRASGSRPHSSTASMAASGGASTRCSQPPTRSNSLRAASAESVAHCTSAAPSSSERMRVVTTTAEREA